MEIFLTLFLKVLTENWKHWQAPMYPKKLSMINIFSNLNQIHPTQKQIHALINLFGSSGFSFLLK